MINNFRLSNFFKFKDGIHDSSRSSLVYKYVCDRCNSIYVGKTSRHLKSRISEHLGVSYRTGQKLTSPPFSAIRNHIDSSHHNYQITDKQFSILATATCDSDLFIKESIFIKQLKPNLNNTDSVQLRVL